MAMTDQEFEQMERALVVDYFRLGYDCHTAGEVLTKWLVDDVVGECELTYQRQGELMDSRERCIAEGHAITQRLGRFPDRSEHPTPQELMARRLELRDAFLAEHRGPAPVQRPGLWRRTRRLVGQRLMEIATRWSQ